MSVTTCSNCNVDIDPEELKANFLRCPTCGFDLSEGEDDEEDWEEEEEGDDFLDDDEDDEDSLDLEDEDDDEDDR